jgi:hypothetical protein
MCDLTVLGASYIHSAELSIVRIDGTNQSTNIYTATDTLW